MQKFISKLFIFFIGLLVGVIITFNTLGIILGNIIYQELSDPKLNINITGIVNHSQDLTRISELERTFPNVQKITLPTTYDGGQTLTGTFIDNNNDKTVILIHGLYQNRSMSVDYISTYARLGFNVLLIDLRGHGESGGIITWGQTEIKDIDTWCDYLRNTQKQRIIGIHGVSLGGAFALLHSGFSLHHADFYVEDSSYGDLKSLYYNHLHNMIQLPANSKMLDILWTYSQICMYWHTGATLDDLSPQKAVQKDDAPILFLHCDGDTLIPPATVYDLYNKCHAPKQMYMFKNTGHAQGITDYPEEYNQVIYDFLLNNKFIS